MKNFYRAMVDAAHHWPALVLATLCSMGVAILWSGNIGALLPVIDMTLKGTSIQQWAISGADNHLKEMELITSRLIALNESIDPVLKSRDEASPSTLLDTEAIQKELRVKQAEYKRIQSALAWDLWSYNVAAKYFPSTAFPTICMIMGILIVSTVVKHGLVLSSDLLIGHVSTTITRNLRTRIFDRTLEMDRTTFQQFGSSGLVATITSTADSLSQGLMNVFGALIREPLRIIACLILACFICWRLVLISMIFTPLMIVIVVWSQRRIKAIAGSVLNRNLSFYEVIMETLGNIFTVQAYTMENAEKKRFADSTKSMQACSMKMILVSGVSRPFLELVGISMVAMIVCVGSYLVINNATHIGFIRICDEPMDIGKLMIFFGLLVGASDPLRKLSGVSLAINNGAIAADSIYGLLDQPIPVRDRAVTAECARPHKTLRFSQVSFHYTPERPVIRPLDLEIQYGSTVALIGPNGSGKSTMVQLLARFYDPTSGSIQLDGVDYRDMKVEDLRKRIALVSQTAELFNRSVMENILYGNPEASPEDAMEAAKKAHAHDFISNNLAQGYDTIVGQAGQKLSGGQRQRIALARAILRKPEILILDESTSQIDLSSELQIRQTLHELKGCFTMIIITHREALLAIADSVYELREGRFEPIFDRQTLAA